MSKVKTGETLQDDSTRIKEVYFPNGGVFSVTMAMRNGNIVEVATVGSEGMLGVGVFFGDRSAAGRTFQQVPDGENASCECYAAIRTYFQRRGL